MTVDQELERFYGDLRSDPEAEQRIIAAVTRTRSARAPRWQPMLVVATSIVAAVATTVLVAVLRPEGRPGQREPVVHGDSAASDVPATVVVPPARRDAVVGAVARDGRALAGVQVELELPPNAAALAHLKKDEALPAFVAGSTTTNAQGGFTLSVDPTTVPSRYVDHGTLDANVDIVLADGRETAAESPIHLRQGHGEPMSFVFDIGRMTVTINGETSALRWADLASTASPEKTP